MLNEVLNLFLHKSLFDHNRRQISHTQFHWNFQNRPAEHQTLV